MLHGPGAVGEGVCAVKTIEELIATAPLALSESCDLPGSARCPTKCGITMRIEKSGRTTMAPRKRCEQMILLAFFIKHFLFIESPSSAGKQTKTVRHLPQGYFCWAQKVNSFPASPGN